MKFKDYLEWKGIKNKEAAAKLGVTHWRIQQLRQGQPAGRKLGARIVEWTNGAVSLEEILYPQNTAA